MPMPELLRLSGAGSPENVVTGRPGDTWQQTDAVAEGGFVIWRKLAGAAKSGWTIESGTTGVKDASPGWAPGFSGVLSVERVGRLVVATIAMPSATPTLAGGWNTIATFPAGYRPAAAINFPWFNAVNAISRGIINTDGTVWVWGSGATASSIIANPVYFATAGTWPEA